ncbi:MAG: hypothetical protein ACUVWV_14955 [Thermodesulfobacteriota bacterium]
MEKKNSETDYLYQVVITGDSIAPEALDIFSHKCHLTFTGSYPPLLFWLKKYSKKRRML